MTDIARHNWRDKLESSREIVNRAVIKLNPYAIVVMVSGGDDSLTAYHVARFLDISIDAIIHVVTGTGIPETTEYVRKMAESATERYLEANASGVYESYVLRKGFFGRGLIAHTYAYHLLKADGFRSLLSKNIRQGVRGRKIILLNGARRNESSNRMFTMREPIQREKKNSSNWWVNIINDWSKADCQAFLAEMDIKRNPVTEKLCRSGECMCGTMQSQEERREAAFWYPDWGRWLDNLEHRVVQKFPWRWGDNIPTWWKQEQKGQLRLFEFQPMCMDCINED